MPKSVKDCFYFDRFQVERHKIPAEPEMLTGPLSLDDAKHFAEEHQEGTEPYALCIRRLGGTKVEKWYSKNGYLPRGSLLER